MGHQPGVVPSESQPGHTFLISRRPSSPSFVINQPTSLSSLERGALSLPAPAPHGGPTLLAMRADSQPFPAGKLRPGRAGRRPGQTREAAFCKEWCRRAPWWPREEPQVLGSSSAPRGARPSRSPGNPAVQRAALTLNGGPGSRHEAGDLAGREGEKHTWLGSQKGRTEEGCGAQGNEGGVDQDSAKGSALGARRSALACWFLGLERGQRVGAPVSHCTRRHGVCVGCGAARTRRRCLP